MLPRVPSTTSVHSVPSEDPTRHFPSTPPSVSSLTFLHPPRAYSFAAAGWLKIYYFGVASFLQDHSLDKPPAKFVGSSAGSLVAAGLVLNVDFRAVRDFALRCVENTHGYFTPAFRLHEMVQSCLELMLDDKAHTRLDNRLEVSVTALPFCQNRRYNTFSSAKDFHQALLASCCMAPLAGFPFKYRGEWIFDGGLSDFQPMLDAHTITISPFFFAHADIKPSRYVPPWWAVYPPRKEDIAWLFDLGFHDAHTWAKKKGVAAGTPTVPMFLGKEHNMSFGRFFGYRSILRIVPSWILTVLFGFLFFFVVRPLSMMLIFVELFGSVVYYLCHRDVEKCTVAAGQCLNPALFLRGFVPGLSLWLPLNQEALFKSSVLYRVAVHYL